MALNPLLGAYFCDSGGVRQNPTTGGFPRPVQPGVDGGERVVRCREIGMARIVRSQPLDSLLEPDLSTQKQLVLPISVDLRQL